MDYREKISSVINNMDLGEPIFQVDLSRNRVNLSEASWSADLNEGDLIDRLVNRHARRSFSRTEKKYTIDTECAIQDSEREVMRDIIDIFIRCSPNAKPRRTIIFKDFYNAVDCNKHNDEFKSAMFDIYEYYFDNTLTESISSTNNDVHRTNIYQLLCLMEKKYGKKTSKQ